MLSKISLGLVIIGGINWLLVGLLNFNLVSFLFGGGSILSRIIYVVIGVCAVLSIPLLMMGGTEENNM